MTRSLLFVPGDSEKKLEKGLSSGADALIIDLEDSVAIDRKPAAREIARAFISAHRGREGGPLLYLRVNALATGLTDADLDSVAGASPDAIMLPKAEGGASVQHLAAKIAVREAEAGLPDGAIASSPSRPRRRGASSSSAPMRGRPAGSSASHGAARTSPPIWARRPTGSLTAPTPTPIGWPAR